MALHASRRTLLLAAPLAALATATACGSDETTTGTPGAGGSAPAEATGFPVTVEHALGTAEIPSAPQRIVCVGWGSQDVLWALGLQPVAVPEVTYGGLEDGTYPWWEGHFDPQTTTFIASPDSGELPIEEIAAQQPDLVLGVYSGMTQAEYDALSQIAPTVAYPSAPWQTSWQDQALLVGRAVGREEDARTLVEDTEADLAARGEENPELAGKTVAYVSPTTEFLYVYLPGDSRVDLLHDLGLEDAPGVTTLGEQVDAFYTEVSKENVRDIDSDIVIGYGLPEAEFTADPVYSTMPAVASGAVAWLEDESLVSATSATVLNLPWQLDRLVPLLADAAAAADAAGSTGTAAPAS
ncbi:iron-siderophore ABC transporter substrate-binding protein [Kineococcus terrestris]|uniref:iron-siderophore ABC transporter substrate-binding protein n=1 Tax=Kineococcus terrestris TaxID=2044856 RepID=UPI0034DB325B